MDNYDLSNLPLLGHSTHSGEHHPRLTDEENRRATFSRRSVIVSSSEQTELQGYPSTGDEQIPEQRMLADFGMSLAPNILEPLIVDDSEDPFAALAAYQSFTFEDDSRHSFDRELDFFEGFSAESVPDVVLAEPEWNDFLELSVRSEHPQQLEPTEQPEQSQDELDAKGISIPESANPDTVSGKRRAPERRNVLIRGIPKSAIEHSIKRHFQESLRRMRFQEYRRRSKGRAKKGQKLHSTKSEIVPLPQGLVTKSQSVTKPERSAISEQDTDQNPNETLTERIKRETEKWIAISEDEQGEQYLCSYPYCGHTATSLGHLKSHIFCHIRISKHKCTYPECAQNGYFRDASDLLRHMHSRHYKKDKFYICKLCNISFNRFNTYKVHLSEKHDLAP